MARSRPSDAPRRGPALHRKVTWRAVRWSCGALYELTETVVFTPADSGTATAPVTYTAYPGESPILAGGRRVTGWQPLGDGLYQAKLPDVLARGGAFRSLFADGRRQVRARYPNADPADRYRGGFSYVAQLPGVVTGSVGNIHNAGDWLEYAVDVPADGRYHLWVFYGHQMLAYNVADMAGRTFVAVDGGEPVPLVDLPDTGGWNATRWGRSAQLDLRAGQHRLRWENRQGGGLNLAAFLLVDDPAYIPASPAPAKPAVGRHRVVIQAEQFRASHGKQITIGAAVGGGSRDTIPCAPRMIKPSWVGAPDVDVHIFPSDPNSCRAFKLIVQVTAADPAAGELKVGGPECIVSMFPGDRFYVDNLRAELDAPTEWYYDQATGVLTWQPDAPPDGLTVLAPAVGQILRVEGDAAAGRPVTGLRFERLTFTANDWSPADGCVGYGMGSQGTVHLVGARDCRVTDCTFAAIGKYAVAADRCETCAFDRNTVRDSAEGGILLLDTHSTSVSDNDIERIGEVYKHVGGVVLQGPGRRTTRSRTTGWSTARGTASRSRTRGCGT